MISYSRYRWLAVFGAIGISLLTRLCAPGNPVPPPGDYGDDGCFCPYYAWTPLMYPSVSITAIADQEAEPATVGYPVQRMLSVEGIPGQLQCVNNPSCLKFWVPTIDRVYWESPAFSPSSGDCIIVCAPSIYKPAGIIPSTAGQFSLALKVDASATQPIWSQSPAALILTTITTFEQKRTAHWKFNDSYTGNEGQQPVAPPANVQFQADWNHGALKVDSTTGAPSLAYLAKEANGNPNATRNQGSIRFWFKPDWSTSSGGPGAMAKLVEIIEGASASKLVIRITSTGQKIEFETSGSICGVFPTTHFSQNINWLAGGWHQIVVTYSSTSSALYIDGSPVVSGAPGVDPLLYACSTIHVGNGPNGQNQAKGWFDELETHNYPLSPAAIQQKYLEDLALDTDNDGLPNLQEVVVGTDPYDPDTDGDGCLDGSDDFPLIPEGCYQDPGDTAPPSLLLIQPANATLIP